MCGRVMTRGANTCHHILTPKEDGRDEESEFNVFLLFSVWLEKPATTVSLGILVHLKTVERGFKMNDRPMEYPRLAKELVPNTTSDSRVILSKMNASIFKKLNCLQGCILFNNNSISNR